jgi:hypothetical protein
LLWIQIETTFVNGQGKPSTMLFELLQNAETFLKRFTVNHCNIIYRSYKLHAWSIFCYFRFGSTVYGKFFPRQNGNDFLINLIERKSEKLNIINVVFFYYLL